jgi:hypothetical protein
VAQDQQAPALARPGRRRLWNVLLALLIFVSGIGVGSGLTVKFMTNAFKRSFQKPDALADQISNRMKRRLDLTDEQTEQVRRILAKNMAGFRALRAEFRPRLISQLEKTLDELESVLTPEQSRKMRRRFRFFLKFWVPSERAGEWSGLQQRHDRDAPAWPGSSEPLENKPPVNRKGSAK